MPAMYRRAAVRWAVQGIGRVSHGRSLLVVLALTLSSCGLQEDLSQRATDPGLVSPTAAPALAGTALIGPALDIHSWRGHPVLIDWWASWCGPCRAEQPQLNALYRKFSPRGVRFMGVDFRDNTDAGKAFISEFRVPYPSIFDADEATTGPWQVDAPPTLVIVDGTGNIRARFLGTLVGIDSLLTQLLNSRA
ncbi:MAG: TlpA family protein disulfide reductase [Chloroflexi bacterium]|nr:MAG: TlpA family protein disulfide reductase [Chloroflexota bacterium]